MTYLWCTWLADALRAEGCRVKEYDGWKNRGRPSSTGSFNPYALLLHHTGTKTSASNPNPTLSTCVNGRSDLPGPLCHVLIGYDGTCHVIAAGRANHAGECNGNGPTSSGDGNAQMIGFELDYSGSQPVSDAQADATGRASAAVLKKFKRDQTYCRGHKETSSTGKWDPGRNGSSDPAYDMNEVRARIATRLSGGTGDDDMPAYLSLSGPKMTLRADGVWHNINFDTENSDANDVHSDPGSYPSLLIGDSRYTGMLTLKSVERADAAQTSASIMVRWAEYDADNVLQSATSPHEYVLSTGGTSLRDAVVDTCAPKHKVRCQVLANSGDLVLDGTGVRVLYWQA